MTSSSGEFLLEGVQRIATWDHVIIDTQGVVIRGSLRRSDFNDIGAKCRRTRWISVKKKGVREATVRLPPG
jgi:hypothetical protein